MDYKLGQIIEAKSQLQRKGKYLDGENKELKTWVEYPLKETKKVMVIGARNLQNGYNDYLSEYGAVFNYTETVKALLVVENLNRKPFYIPTP